MSMQGITMLSSNPRLYSKLSYQGKKFEKIEIELENDDEDEDEEENNEIKNAEPNKTMTIVKMTW